MHLKITRLPHHFLRYNNLNLILFGHLLDKIAPKPPINKDAFDLPQQRMVGQSGPPGQGTFSVVSVGGQHLRGERDTEGINQIKPLAAFD